MVYRIAFDANCIADAEKETGLNLLYALRNLDTMSMGQMRALLFGLSKKHNAQVLLKDAGDLLTRDDGTVWNAMKQVLDVRESDEDLLWALSRMAVERPVALVDLLAQVRTFVPATQPETKPKEAKPESVAQ